MGEAPGERLDVVLVVASPKPLKAFSSMKRRAENDTVPVLSTTFGVLYDTRVREQVKVVEEVSFVTA